ncbi:MAG: glycosyl hydrolase family 5 [Fibrobacter sp.]|nr:glycosyl hydrolase family 5 [Fibrobacter sp.]
MKFPFFKTLMVASLLTLACSCSEDTVSRVSHDPKGNYIVAEASYVYVDKKNNVYLISTQGIVSDTTGTQIGIADIATGYIVNNTGSTPEVIATDVDFTKLEVVAPTIVTGDGWVLNAGQNLVIYKSNNWVTDAQGNVVGIFNPTAGTVGNITTVDGSIMMVEGVDLSTLKPVTANASSASVSGSSGSNPGVSSANTPGSSANIPGSSAKSSSSSATSSSSSVKSSSSVAQSSSSAIATGNCPVIKYVNGGASGSGYASRYWDCCKPHCASNGSARTCDNRGNVIDNGQGSMCEGGPAGACLSQVPFTIEGCDTYGFAFAAVPGNMGGQCGHCYELTFTGTACYYENGQKKNSTNDNSKKLKTQGKKLIVMASNIGHDVQGGQFDVMIPGGGFGIFDGCSSKMGWGNQGERYGGLLSTCEKEANYVASKTKSCLKEKCLSAFGSDKQAQQGCLFLAEWMNAASNPEHTFKEVECPQVLKQKY